MAETVKVEGLIKQRHGETMILQTSDNPSLTVLLTDNTEVGQVQGLFKARRKQMSMAALIPGLQVQVEGMQNEKDQLVAKLVKFKGDDLERAQSIEAGLHETKAQTQQNRAELEKQSAALAAQKETLRQQQANLTEQRANLTEQKAKLTEQQAQLTEQQAKITANKAAIADAVARFGQLDDYYIFDEVTVYFANGKVAVDPKYNPQLLALANKAKTIEGYLIEVKGYASSVGSVTLNQKLSEDRAHNVTNILLQQGNIPLTRMLAPAAMGESHQVGNDRTAEGQAENRRVVVRVLQNKGVAGS
jgi:outer membrane protein OmpA-like peptidoglycan-associated protein